MMRPYISLDIETTGTNIQKSGILQIGAVYDDGKNATDKLQTFKRFIKWDPLPYSELGAIAMNSWILKGIQLGDLKAVSIEQACDEFIDFVEKHRGKYRMQIAGKNLGSFDIPILKNNMTPDQRARFENLLQHRYLDVGSAFAPIFGYNPALDVINKKIGYKQVTHDALDDAMNVVAAFRWLENTYYGG